MLIIISFRIKQVSVCLYFRIRWGMTILRWSCGSQVKEGRIIPRSYKKNIPARRGT